VSWADFAAANAGLATHGRDRLHGRVCYLATVRADGSPRVHPVTPDITATALYVFMEPTSPKGHDLRRDPRYALHGGVEDNEGGEGEFLVTGRATLVDDAAERATAAAASPYQPLADRYILFRLGVEHAMRTTYADGGPVRERWDARS
jgi:hypothetical protein